MQGQLKGQIIAGSFSELLMRQKSEVDLELGELLTATNSKGTMLFKVTDIKFASQISDSNLELVSGLKLEHQSKVNFMEPELRNYKIASLKSLAFVSGITRLTKSLPDFFSDVYSIDLSKLTLLKHPEHPLFLGNLRSGGKSLDYPIFLEGTSVLSHHILIPATTGRGKSNLTSCMLWNCLDKEYCGLLVLDPHDEYYGRTGLGMKDHPEGKVEYYTPKDPPPGAKTLKIHIESLKPQHFRGSVDWSDPQKEAIYAYYQEYKEKWIEKIILEEPITTINDFNEATIAVVRRRLKNLLKLKKVESINTEKSELMSETKKSDDQIKSTGIFSANAGQSTIRNIVSALEQSKTVIVDTSLFEGAIEILIGSVVSSETFSKYKRYKTEGILEEKPVISIVLEEAPRVLGKDVLERGSNIFSQIAREGRKFKIGLWAITQLPSLIPRQILANMNTKIILGIEMAAERQAIIDSAAQDLSADDRAIASLDTGEAVISTNFAKFAVPVKIPLFSELVKNTQNELNAEKYSNNSVKTMFVGLK